MVGGKTGFTLNARHCFVGAMDTEKGLIFTAVLGARSRSRLWQSTLMLADFGENSQPVDSFEEAPVEDHSLRFILTPFPERRDRYSAGSALTSFSSLLSLQQPLK